MAIINPSLCKNRSIQVEVEQRNEGMIPHVHVYLDHTRDPKECAYIRLDKPEYSSHHSNGKTLKSNQKKEFIEIMYSIWNAAFIQSRTTDEVRRATGYQAAVNTWIDTFGETVSFTYDLEGFPVMPDYSKL